MTSCDVEGDSTVAAALLSQPRDEPRAAPWAAGQRDCHGDALPTCDTGWTGPSCDTACDAGAPGCGLRYYCHADGRIAGIALSRAHLFAIGPTLGPNAVRDLLEQWVATHESELELPDGLTTAMLQLEPADDFEVEQGLLTLYRFQQLYPASSAHPRVPVVGEGALLSLQADPTGAIALTGTLVDPRVPYAHARSTALASQARASIVHHASARTGIPEADIEVAALQLVAVPWAEELAWYGVPMAGSLSIGRMIVDADPAAPPPLDLLMYDDGKAYALHDTTPITVQTQDPLEDPWANPVLESSESTLANGAPLLGSIFDGNSEPQLASEEVVVMDLHGNPFMTGSLYDAVAGTWDFERYTEANGQFTQGDPDQRFRAQRLYHLVKSGHAVVDRVARGKWDSAISYWDPTLQSAHAPGTYRPRIVVGYNHAPIGAAGQADWRWADAQPASYVLSGFPEIVQQPAPNLNNEPVATINAPLGLIDADVLLHEVGHDLDLFLAPGYPDSYAPHSCPGCTACNENTSDEANPLTETIAQMFAMWQLVRIFPDMPHDTCNLMNHLTGGTTNNQKNVHSPGCMDSSDSIGLFIRDDDPACPDASICDKPSNDEADATMGSAHWCDATEGYNTFSILQAWWNSLHGLYCEPPGPMGVTCAPQAVIWPPGCDQPGSGIDCATPDEVAGLAFLYAVRSNPTSYAEFFDAMATFVSCNYGAQSYDDFNQGLCDHQIRACDEPPPMSCQECGNGIREGTEHCDGADLSVDEIGYVPTCEGFGYEGGTLACQGVQDPQPCTYDFSQCEMEGLDETGATAGGATTIGEVSVEPVETEDSTSPGGADDGGEDGCTCAASGRPGGRGMLFPVTIAFLFVATRRRGRPSAVTRALGVGLLVALGPVSCAECTSTDDVVSAEAASASTTMSASSMTDTQASTNSETSSAPPGWPEDWYGDYYDAFGLTLGIDYPGEIFTPGGLGNMRLTAGALVLERFYYRVDSETVEWTFATELEGDVLRVLPPGGEWEVLYRDAEEVLIRPGAGCDEVLLEVHGFPSPSDPVVSTPWQRGSLCVTDPYDDTVCCDKWSIDLCPGSVLDCEG